MKILDRWRNILQAITYILIGMTVLVAAIILWQWYKDDGGFEAMYVAVGVVLVGLTWVSNRLAKKPDKPHASSSEPHSLASSSYPSNLESYAPIPAFAPMRQHMNALFTLNDMRLLVYDLGINYDNLAGCGRP